MAVINALHLQSTPEQCLAQLLVVVIKTAFTPSQASSTPISHSFELVDAFVDSIAEASRVYREQSQRATGHILRTFESSSH
ncbi:hypothetical protein L208DRAFT_62353 [Tricholoma matsutake]|nr:hypothetical protein L208DRAFT_62353 [Tricholoma matsutake 945]